MHSSFIAHWVQIPMVHLRWSATCSLWRPHEMVVLLGFEFVVCMISQKLQFQCGAFQTGLTYEHFWWMNFYVNIFCCFFGIASSYPVPVLLDPFHHSLYPSTHDMFLMRESTTLSTTRQTAPDRASETVSNVLILLVAASLEKGSWWAQHRQNFWTEL